jgi:hypothetical protein
LRPGKSVAKYQPKRMRSRSPTENVNAGDMGRTIQRSARRSLQGAPKP